MKPEHHPQGMSYISYDKVIYFYTMLVKVFYLPLRQTHCAILSELVHYKLNDILKLFNFLKYEILNELSSKMIDLDISYCGTNGTDKASLP